MKKNRIIFALSAVSLALLTACGDNETLSPYEGEEPVRNEKSIPQGDHDYDAVIMDWHRRYNVLPLYIFDDRDYYWSVTGDIRWYYDAGQDRTMAGYTVEPADQEYVGQLLELVEQKIFKYFPDETLAKLLPMKVLLASRIVHNPGSFHGEVPESDYIYENCLSGYDYVCFSGALPKIENMGATDRNQYKKDGVQMILEKAITAGTIRADDAFYAISDYDGTYNSATCLQAGLLNEYVSTESYDLRTYVNLIVSTPYEQIRTGYLNKYSLVKEKYEIVVNSFMEKYNIDLQAIGNDVEK